MVMNKITSKEKQPNQISSACKVVSLQNSPLSPLPPALLICQTLAENEELREDLSEVTAQHNSVLEENQRLRAKLENLEQVLKVPPGRDTICIIVSVAPCCATVTNICFSLDSICVRSLSEGSSWNWNMSRHWLSLSSNRMKSNDYSG